MTADSHQQYAEDVSFIRHTIEHRDRTHNSPMAIAVLWAGILIVGFALIDFNRHLVPWFWAIASPAGAILSAKIGYRAVLATGVTERGQGMRHAMHWPVVFLASGAVLAIVTTHQLPPAVYGPLFTLISGIVWFLGGVHLDRRFLAPGAMLIIGSAVVNHLGPYPWTILGLAIAIALITSAIWMRPGNAETDTAS